MSKNIANRHQTLRLLKKYEQKAKKHLGQNFMVDPNVVQKIARESVGSQREVCLEIGPGLGALTEQLAQEYNKVIAYEIDEYMVEILQESLEEYDNVTVIHEDFLKANLSEIPEPITVCANLPYYITTPLLFRLMELDVDQMTLMVQKEIGERLAAKVSTKDYSSLSIQIQYYFDVEKIMKVSPESFLPKPNVDSIVVKLRKRNDATMPYDEKVFFEFVRASFQFRRKTLMNNLKAIDKHQDYLAVFEKLGWDVRVRAEDLTLEDFLDLYGALYA